MSGFLFCTCYLDNSIVSCHPLRYKKWINYYLKLMADLHVDYIFLIDDGSLNFTLENFPEVEIHYGKNALPTTLSKKVNIITFKDHLGRASQYDYRGWWRSFTYSIKIAEKYGFKKIVHIESDFYVVSDRLTSYIQSLNEGWTSLFSSEFDFPETAVQIICQDSFHLLENVRSTVEASNYTMSQIAEKYLPFTNVCKKYHGDRLVLKVLKQYLTGENGIDKLDYYGELPTYVRPISGFEFQALARRIGTTMNVKDTLNEDAIIEILRQNNMLINIS